MHRQIVFVKVDASFNYLKAYIRYPKHTLVHHIGEVRSCYNRNKTYVPVFYRGNKLWVLVLVRVIKSYEQELVPIIYYRNKPRVPMFYFLTTSTTIIITITATTKNNSSRIKIGWLASYNL